MADIPLAPPTPPSSTAATSTTTSGLVAVQVSVTNVPTALQELVRIIQTNATPVVVSDANNLTLGTALGNVTVALSQQLGVAEKQNLIQQLMTLLQIQRPLTLTLQPGSPPTQGALLFPMTATPAIAQNVQTNYFPATPSSQAKPLAQGDTFNAIVLPPLPAPAVVLATAPPPSAITNLAASRPLIPPVVSEDVLAVLSTPIPSAEKYVFEQNQGIVGYKQTSTLTPSTPETSQQSTVPLPTQMTSPVSQTSSPPPQAPFVQQTVTPPQIIEPVVQTNVAPSTPAAQQVPTPASQPIIVPTQQAKAFALPKGEIPVAPPSVQTASAKTSPPVEMTKGATPSQPSGAMPQLPPSAVQPSPQIPQQTALLLTAGNEISMRVVSFLPAPHQETSTVPTRIPELAPNQILATVGGTGTGGQLILKSGDITLYVKAQVSAPPGSSVILSIEGAKNTPLMTLPATEHPVFEALPQALAALEQFSPHAFQNVMMNFLPRPTEALPGALMFLLSAFKQGNVRGWLGEDAVESLKDAGKYEIINHLSKELSSAGKPVQDTIVGEWRSYPIPLYGGQQFQALTLYVHNDRDAHKEKSGGQKGVGRIRFLIDMRFSKLGAMQIDGFVQPKKLDMILRSENTLPEGLHHELRTAYIKALDAVAYTGTLNFQVGRQHWLVMQKEAPKGIVT